MKLFNFNIFRKRHYSITKGTLVNVMNILPVKLEIQKYFCKITITTNFVTYHMRCMQLFHKAKVITSKHVRNMTLEII